MTTVGDGLYHYGGIPVGSGMLPITGLSSDGTMSGRAFYVHGYLGNDGNSGLKPKAALKTLTAAYALLEDGRGDTVYILNDGSTTATVRDVALTWAKDNCHIVGLCAPTLVNQRARIAPAAAVTTVTTHTPYLTLSASGCIISNVSWFQGQSEDSQASIGINLTGHRNYLYNVGIITGAHANQGDEVTYNLKLAGSENTFENCYIGQDTAARSNFASANVAFTDASEASRNIFRNCIFPMWADGAGPLFVTALGLTAIQRWNLFENCNFINTGTSTITQGVNVPGSATGRLFFKDCAFFGCTDVTAATNTLVQLSGNAIGTGTDISLYGSVTV